MKRKIIKHGNSSLSITLPSIWVKHNNLQNSDEVDVQVNDHKLIVSTHSSFSGDRFSISLTKEHIPIIRTFLASIHEYGFDEVEISYDDPKVFDIIKHEQGLLLGFEIMEQSDCRCLMKSISTGIPNEFDNIVKRLAQVTIALSKTTHEKLERGDLNRVEDILSLEETNNKLSDYCQRIINKVGYQQPKKACFVYVTCWQLEKIADDYRNLVISLRRNCGQEVKISDDIMKLLEKANLLLDSYLRLYTRFDIEKLTELKHAKDLILSKAYIALKRDMLADHIAVCHIISLVTRITDLTSSCIATNLDGISETRR